MKKEKIYKNINPTEELIKIKHKGKIYTPDYLVKIILNQGHYILGNINKKHIMENSCGDGQFLIYIVDRYCKDFLKKNNDLKKLKRELEKYIHGIDCDKEEIEICKNRCAKVVEKYGIKNVKWDFINANTLKIDNYDGKMDFVIGNPPYVRVHNLNDDFDTVKSYLFGNGGMTDLYIAFYEKGLKMLNKTGILCYITPSSFFTSIAGTTMRNYYNKNKLLESVCNLKHFQPFNSITYTAIICLNKSKENIEVKYSEFNEKDRKIQFIANLKQEDYIINGNYYFSSKNNLKLLKKILNNNIHTDIMVKNGFATLADNIFIKDFQFNSKYVIPVLKGSKAKWIKIFYPYDRNGQIIKENELKKDKEMYKYLLSQKEKLIERSIKEKDIPWYAFGRTQAIKDTYKDKLGINSLIKTSEDLKIEDIPSGKGIYSGLYIISDTIPLKSIKNMLLDKEFGIYVSLLGKYKSGGYYTFSSKDVKIYLDYKIKLEKEKQK